MRYLIALALLTSLSSVLNGAVGVSKFTNPICGAADPCIVKNPDGPGYWYVYVGSDGIFSEFALSPADFEFNFSNKIFAAEPGTNRAADLWAPELHRVKGKWYIYFCAGAGGPLHQRMFVISGDDPMKPFGNPVCLGDYEDDNAIDQTVFEWRNKLYTVYSGRNIECCQRLIIAEMESPTKIKDKRVILSSPEYEWEKYGWPVIEGPVALKHKDKLFLVYAASGGTRDEYCLGVMTFKGGDILDPANWEKHPKPVMTGRGNIQATGHCNFTTDADGDDWCVFHCNPPHNEENFDTWVPRFLCLQKVIWVNDFPTFSPVVEKPKYFKYER